MNVSQDPQKVPNHIKAALITMAVGLVASFVLENPIPFIAAYAGGIIGAVIWERLRNGRSR